MGIKYKLIVKHHAESKLSNLVFDDVKDYYWPDIDEGYLALFYETIHSARDGTSISTTAMKYIPLTEDIREVEVLKIVSNRTPGSNKKKVVDIKRKEVE